MIQLWAQPMRRSRRFGSTRIGAGESVLRAWATEGPEELLTWAAGVGLLAWAMRWRPMPHFLVWGDRRARCYQIGEGIELADAKAWAADVAAWAATTRPDRLLAAALG